MKRGALTTWADRGLILAVLILAALLRSNLSYRTAFSDEAYNIFGGWQLLHGQNPYAMLYHMGWQHLSLLPLGLADGLGGLEAARGLNAVWGVLTVLVVLLVARRLYGKAAGYLAGGIFAVYGPAIFIGTFATYDSLSVFLLALAVLCWVVAVTANKTMLYPAGSLAAVLSILTKYAAAAVVGPTLAISFVAAALAASVVGSENTGEFVIRLDKSILFRLVLVAVPFLLLPAFGLYYQEEFRTLWQQQVITKQVATPGIRSEILTLYASYLWLPLLLSLLALDRRRYRLLTLGLLVIGLSMLAYQLMNQDKTTLFKHTCYSLVGLAPLAAGGLTTTVESLLSQRWAAIKTATVTAALSLVTVGLIAYAGQGMLPNLRSYWADTSELMVYLRENVEAGDVLLMEEGIIARYYLIAHGSPDRQPAHIWDTWWYEGEEGQGGNSDLFQQAVANSRFDTIIFDYMMTGDLDSQLLPIMEGKYELAATFPAHTWFGDDKIDVFERLE